MGCRMNCPNCGAEITASEIAASLGSRGGAAGTDAQAAARRRNGRKGGRPGWRVVDHDPGPPDRYLVAHPHHGAWWWRRTEDAMVYPETAAVPVSDQIYRRVAAAIRRHRHSTRGA